MRCSVPGYQRTIHFLLTAALLAIAFCVPPALAGPLVLTPSISLSEEYNDNIFFDDTQTEDYVTSINAGLSLSYERPRLSVSLSTGSSAQIYARQTSENSATGGQSGSLAMTYRATERLTVSLSDSVTRVERTRTGSAPEATAPVALPAGLQPGPDTIASTLAPHGSALSNYFGASASYRLAPRWSTGVTYSHTLSDFSDPGASDFTNSAGVSLGYLWRPTTSISGSFTYSRFDTDQYPHTQSENPSLGISHQFDPTWSLSAGAGFYVNHPLRSGLGVSTRTGPTWNVDLTKLFAQGSLSAGGGQSMTSSAGVGGASETLSAYLSYQMQLLERVNGFLSGTYGHFDTRETTYQYITATAGLSTTFWRYFTAGVRYSYRWQDNSETTATITSGEQHGNIVQAYISASYPVWRGEM